MDADANLLVLELKRDRTPRDAVAQLLDYGSCVRTLDFVELDRLSQQWQNRSLPQVFESAVGGPIPETVNTSHILVLVQLHYVDPSEKADEAAADDLGDLRRLAPGAEN